MVKLDMKAKVLGLPRYLIVALLALIVVFIILGSCLDLRISEAVSNPSSLLLEYLSALFYSWVFPAAGVLLYKGFLQKGKKPLGIFLFVLMVLYGAYESGAWVAKQYLLVFADNQAIGYMLGYLTSSIIAGVEAVGLYFLIKDDNDPSYMIKLGAMIFLAFFLSTEVNALLKSLASRPRYRNIVQEGSLLAYRNWWEFDPWGGVGDSTRSFPSGHASMVTIVMVLPMLHPLWRFTFKGGEYLSFGVSLSIIFFIGFTRIYNGAHFLSDVSFGILITLIALLLFDFFLFRVAKTKQE